ncbi:MAG TPA: N(4)-(beta-N-acetylglucosaminyl)-L-asparaginase [Myxococcaceae bacterium]|jgi:N4-(beta-N-acetylglucosaminyl)-L-asparaginase|nr:N(4)-(beta-N-acetylglucosaminyl)-L-asparaginase [Myxococcaceae bacterium]
MVSRRTFLAGAVTAPFVPAVLEAAPSGQRPVAVGSYNGLRAVARAVERMRGGTDPLAAAVEGVGIIEDDPLEITVGYGGIPNEECVVQLDASVMDGKTARGGGVGALEGIVNAAAVARCVLETTDHALLVGAGARRFAELNGFPVKNLLTERARKIWLYWKQNLSAKDKWVEPDPDQLDPDVRDFIRQYGTEFFRDPRSNGTVHVSALDAKGDLAGCTSTSGLFFKMPGRVGDSALVGAGCFTDNAVGSAGSTGRGEACMLVGGAHLVVERMRAGRSPVEACLDALRRIAETTRDRHLLDKQGRPAFHIRFYALSKSGAYGAASMWSSTPSGKAPQFAVADVNGARLEACATLFTGSP